MITWIAIAAAGVIAVLLFIAGGMLLPLLSMSFISSRLKRQGKDKPDDK